jgi:hypothetical protein
MSQSISIMSSPMDIRENQSIFLSPMFEALRWRRSGSWPAKSAQAPGQAAMKKF